MTIRGEILVRLAALKLSAEQFQTVLTIIGEVQGAEDRRRQNGRTRTSRWRHSDRHGDVTVTSQSTSHPPPTYTTPPKNSEPKKVLRSLCALPTTWTLDEQDRAYARSKGWPESQIDAEAERFKDHALQKGRKAKDWHAAWRNWVTSPFQKPPQHGENQNGKSILAACDRAIDHFRANGATGDYVPGSSGPKPLRVDLPSGPSGIRSLPKG